MPFYTGIVSDWGSHYALLKVLCRVLAEVMAELWLETELGHEYVRF